MAETVQPLLHCLGCSMSKRQVKPINRSTDSRAVKKLLRVFLDLGGKKQFKSIGGSLYLVHPHYRRRLLPLDACIFSEARLTPPKNWSGFGGLSNEGGAV